VLPDFGLCLCGLYFLSDWSFAYPACISKVKGSLKEWGWRGEKIVVRGLGCQSVWCWCPKVSVWLEVDQDIAWQIWGGNVAFAPREVPRAAVQHNTKSWRTFLEPEWYLMPGKPVACPHKMRGFLQSFSKERGEAKGASTLGTPKGPFTSAAQCVVGKGSPGREQRNLPRSQGACLTLREIISYCPHDRCFCEDQICGRGECGFLDCSPLLYGDEDGVCISNTAWWLSLPGEWLLPVEAKSAGWQLLQDEILGGWGMALMRGLWL